MLVAGQFSRSGLRVRSFAIFSANTTFLPFALSDHTPTYLQACVDLQSLISTCRPRSTVVSLHPLYTVCILSHFNTPSPACPADVAQPPPEAPAAYRPWPLSTPTTTTPASFWPATTRTSTSPTWPPLLPGRAASDRPRKRGTSSPPATTRMPTSPTWPPCGTPILRTRRMPLRIILSRPMRPRRSRRPPPPAVPSVARASAVAPTPTTRRRRAGPSPAAAARRPASSASPAASTPPTARTGPTTPPVPPRSTARTSARCTARPFA